MLRATFLIVCLTVFSHAHAQVFSEDSSNFYVGVSLGQAQHNVTNDYGTYGRSQTFPRLSAEFGYALGGKNFKGLFIIPSVGFSYQQLSLETDTDTNNKYNDKLNLIYGQLNLLLHIGGERFMIFAGPSFQLPLYSRFLINSKTSDGSYKWTHIQTDIENKHNGVATKAGFKIKFGNAQLGTILSVSQNTFSKSIFHTTPYKVNELSFTTLEFILYLPLRL